MRAHILCNEDFANFIATGAFHTVAWRNCSGSENGIFLKLPEQRDGTILLKLKKGAETLAEWSSTVSLVLPQPHLTLIYDHSINYAFQQNAIPVVKELRLQNNGVARKNLVLRLTTEPAFAPSAEIRLQSIEPAGEFQGLAAESESEIESRFPRRTERKGCRMVEGGDAGRP